LVTWGFFLKIIVYIASRLQYYLHMLIDKSNGIEKDDTKMTSQLINERGK